MNRIIPSLFFLIFTLTSIHAQLNVTLIANHTYNTDANDIWGYVDSSGNEYAIVGLRNGVSIMDLSTPSNPVEVAFLPGDNSTWRDIKTWGEYAYITTDQGDDGLMVIDLSNLPTSATATLWTPTLTLSSGASGTLGTAHNIYMDENGYAYISGANIGNNGVLILDVFSTPGTPIHVGEADDYYSHDSYVRGDTLYSSDINVGHFSVYDVSNKANPALLATQTTPFNFTHNAWLSDDSKTLFTTDERANAPVASYDISDLNNIELLDEFRPAATVGQGVIPHNVHVFNDYLIISYYSDGFIVVDAQRPDNLIEVGNYDTYLPNGQGFNGAWGAYPFLPSGLALLSDINTGLYVLQPNYVRGCYLEGMVTDSVSGAALNNVTIRILTTNETANTDALGSYKTGLATAGTYQVEFSLPGYLTKTLPATLNNGVLTVLDVQLAALPSMVLQGTVTDSKTNAPIENALIEVSNSNFDYFTITDFNGNFTINTFFPGDYEIIVGQWGYKTKIQSSQTITTNTGSLTYALEPGYEDIFELNLGWTVSGNASTGQWERDEPIGINYQGGLSAPDSDVSQDIGVKCYVTGNGGASAGANDVDNGNTVLTSPTFDLTTYNEPRIAYYTWFFNDGGFGGPPNDQLEVRLTNGITTVTLETITASNGNWRSRSLVIVDSALITPTANMQIIFETSDLQGSGHLVEAAVDGFKVWDANPINTNTSNTLSLESINVFPNPTSDFVNIAYELGQIEGKAQLNVFNALGQLMTSERIVADKGLMKVGQDFEAGVYMIQVVVDNQIAETIKFIKL